MNDLTFSVVISTYNRAESLRKTLEAFRWQTCRRFEVIVVNGPSTDHTEEVVDDYCGVVTALRCPVANISASRNMGISRAAGDIVAFIDDDGIPYPTWLECLAAGYGEPEVGGVGGFVWDHTGMSYQSRFIVCDRFGEARFLEDLDPSDFGSFPGATWYPSLMGVNSSFRRKALLEIGGFNEIYAYYLDETDVCLRLIDKGYKIVFAPEAKVHHKYLPSHIRDAKKMTKNFYPVIRSKVNFVMSHGVGAKGQAAAVQRVEDWLYERKIEVKVGFVLGSYTATERDTALKDISAAVTDTLQSPGFTNPSFFVSSGEFCTFPALQSRLRLVLVSADFPPMANGGIGTLMKSIGTALAGLGHEVHVITRSAQESVDFEDGAWVHRLRQQVCDVPVTPVFRGLQLPLPVTDWSGTAKRRIDFIRADFGKIDVVLSPIWDLEGACSLGAGDWKSVVTLHTTYAMSLETHPEWKRDRFYYRSFIQKMIEAERALLQSPTFFIANSEGVLDGIEQAYGIAKAALSVVTIPHGVPDYLDSLLSRQRGAGLRGLFVGRLELRKGADVLFQVLPDLFEKFPDFVFDMAGEVEIPVWGRETLVDRYRRQLQPFLDSGRLRILGKVDDAMLPRLYNSCDFFVAPSRFESFGLILAEAMSCGKPVIGCSAGGMTEVVGDAGLLAVPGDPESLKLHIISLISDPDLRRVLGERARSRYEAHFGVGAMAEIMSQVLEGVVHDYHA